MFSEETAIQVSDLSKRYEIYANPRDRLKQFVLPRLQSYFSQRPRQYFQEFWALKNIALELKQGETVGIIGRNGSGKSTLLQLICGTLTPTTGQVKTRGRVAALLELGSGFNPEFTGRENVYLNASVLGLTTAEIDASFEAIAAFADIGDFIEQPVKTYSSGMYVRLAFAVIAHVNADILIIDEALAVGDVFFTQKCMRFLRNFMQKGTVLFVSHDTSSIKSLCTHVIWLDKGKVMQQGPPKEVCEAYLEAMYEAEQGKTVLVPQIKKANEAVVSAPVPLTAVKIIDKSAESTAFGKGGATIKRVSLLDREGSALAWIEGGEMVTLKIEADVNFDFESPIVGFFVKDRSGQMLFGDNTYLLFKDSQKLCRKGEELHATFAFHIPLLPAGDYSVTISIASGSQLQHVQQHWIHDALVFRSNSARVCNGLIGIPILKQSLETVTSAVQRDH